MVNWLTPYSDTDPQGMTLFLFSLRMSLSIYITPLTLHVLWPSPSTVAFGGLVHSSEMMEFIPDFPAMFTLFYSHKRNGFGCKETSIWWWRTLEMTGVLTIRCLSKETLLHNDIARFSGDPNKEIQMQRRKSWWKAEFHCLPRLVLLRSRSWWWRWLCLWCSPVYLQSVVEGKKKSRKWESCFPAPLGNPTTGLSLFAYSSKTLSSQRPAPKASFISFSDTISSGSLVIACLLGCLLPLLAPHKAPAAAWSPPLTALAPGCGSGLVPLQSLCLKQESWTFTSVYS